MQRARSEDDATVIRPYQFSSLPGFSLSLSLSPRPGPLSRCFLSMTLSSDFSVDSQVCEAATRHVCHFLGGPDNAVFVFWPSTLFAILIYWTLDLDLQSTPITQ